MKISNIQLDEHFLPYIKNDVVGIPRAIELGKLIQILNEDFNIILDSIDIYCLYTKLKHLNNDNTSEIDIDNNDMIEEILDYDKLLAEVEEFLMKEKQANEMLSRSQSLSKRNMTSSYQETKGNILSKMESRVEFPQEDFIQAIKTHLKKNKENFADFIKPQNFLKSEISADNTQNKYIDIRAFQELLLSKNIFANIFSILLILKIK